MSINEDKRIIDSNEAVTLKLEEIRQMMTEDTTDKSGFTLGINPENVEELLEDLEQTEEYKEMVSINQEEIRKAADDIIEEAKLRAQEIIGQAQKDANHIVEDAKVKAFSIMENARTEGYEKGTSEGRQSVDEELKRINMEYQKRVNALEEEYLEKRNNMEPELVDTILEVFADVTRAISAEQKDMILGLIDRVLKDAEASNNYIIKVCSEDAKFLKENKESIIRQIGKDINIEIVEDITMKKNECLIDTDFGIYDCSLDIQLENLMQAIRILSCTMEK